MEKTTSAANSTSVSFRNYSTIYSQAKLRNTRDKREVIVRERQLLTERIENLKQSIAAEFEARQ